MGLSLLNASPDRDAQFRSLQQELYQRNQQLNEAEEALRQERLKSAAMERGVSELRTVLSPLYQGLAHIFGQIEGMNITGSPAANGMGPRKSAIWESWKAKLPAGEGRAIDALLLHGTMTTAQLRIHIGCASRTAQNIVQALKSKGLIVKNGAQLSLKEL